MAVRKIILKGDFMSREPHPRTFKKNGAGKNTTTNEKKAKQRIPPRVFCHYNSALSTACIHTIV